MRACDAAALSELTCRFRAAVGTGACVSACERQLAPASPARPKSAKKSPPLSSTMTKAGKSFTSMRQTASMPSSGYSSIRPW